MGILERLSNLPKTYHIAVGLLLVMVIGYVDYVTGFELRMELFYLVPISYVTWFVGQRIGIMFSLISLVTIVFSDIMAGKKYAQFTIEFWNGAMYFAFYIIVTVLLKLRKTLQQRESLIEELDRALNMNEELNSMLPICANCKKVRDDDEYRHKVEFYIDKHAKTTFSQGLCRECSAKLSSPGIDRDEMKPSC
ncbi:MAG TPA: hypothetical protein VL197_08245 [Nitrospirota bacterium]|nr:hypothetical protein [Nitrospirota bacterium]